MSSAGQRLIAGRIPGELIGETIATADSATFTTTETVVMSITVPLVAGRTYRILASGMSRSDIATDDIRWRIREDNATGTELQTLVILDVNSTAVPPGNWTMEARYTAASTASKVVVVTGVRNVGSGNCALEAAATRPAFLSCYYHSG